MMMESITLNQLVTLYDGTDIPVHIEALPNGEPNIKGTW